MKFCTECNSIYTTTEVENKIKYICKVCGHIEDCTNLVIDTTYYKEREVNRGEKNEYTIYDVTLPRTNKKPCPNKDCKSNVDKDLREVVMLSDKYTQKLYYTCCVCNTEWTYS